MNILRLSVLSTALILVVWPLAAMATPVTGASAFAANATLPGFAPATPAAAPGSTLLQGSSWTTPKPQVGNVPPPPVPPVTQAQIDQALRADTAPKPPAAPPPASPAAGRLPNFSHPPAGAPAPPLPSMPPVPPVVMPQSMPSVPSDIIEPSRLKDGTTPVSGSLIEATAGDNRVFLIKVSGTAPNLIQSPFENPRVLTTSNTSVQFKAHGRNIVISVTQAGPVGIYITGSRPSDPMVGLVLDPSASPPRSYTLDVKGYSPKSVPTSASESYVQSAVSLMRDVVAHRVPPNFSQVGQDRLPQDQMFFGVRLHPVRQYVAPGQSILVLDAKNENLKDALLVENDFYSKGVVAVVINGSHELRPGQSTEVYILSSKSQPESALLGVWHGADSARDEDDLLGGE